MSGEHHRPALSPEGQRDKEHSKACLFYLRFQLIRQRDFPSGRPVAQGTNQAGGTACAADSAPALVLTIPDSAVPYCLRLNSARAGLPIRDKGPTGASDSP